VNSDFTLRALAAQLMLRLLRFTWRNAAWKPVIHAYRSENKVLKDQVADIAAFCLRS